MTTATETKPRPKGGRASSTTKPGTKSGKGKRRRRREPVPVATGRFITVTILLAALAIVPFSPLGNLFVPKEEEMVGGGKWEVGKSDTVRITLVTADYDRLACASEEEAKGKHCAYKTEKERWPPEPGRLVDDNKKDEIQPYRTWPDNRLIMVAGLWAEPAVATRLHREPPAGIQVDKLARFVVECKVEFLANMQSPQLRWAPGQRWINEGNAMLGVPSDCKLASTADDA
jgi:hypothetical protein